MVSRLADRNVLLTGANSGIGFAVLQLLLKQGNKVFAVDLNTDAITGLDGCIPYTCDISVKENIDMMFTDAVSAMGRIDMFYANAGFSYYGDIGGPDWERIDRIYRTNVYSVIYSYEVYAEYLHGREGIFAVTDSAMGLMGMPGFAIYTSTKFAINGFQDAIRYEKPENLQVTFLYPVSTDTNFFRTASAVEFDRPYPVQDPVHVAERMVSGIEHGKKRVFPCRLFSAAMIVFKFLPFVKTLYIRSERRKLEKHRSKVLDSKKSC